MQEFRTYLQQEFVRRTTKNPSYSLRSFAQQVGMNHATLSSLISGKRKITPATIQKLAQALDLSPEEVASFTRSKSIPNDYFVLQQDAFVAMSDWYFDAILELALIPNFKLEPEVISTSIGITQLNAKIALETLERLELLDKDKSGKYKIRHQNSINILDSDFTSAANRKYQRSILEKSLEALNTIDRKNRDHTSTTIAIDKKDLPQAKELIQKFRHQLTDFLQIKNKKLNEVYQLQVAFFPLSQNFKLNETEQT